MEVTAGIARGVTAFYAAFAVGSGESFTAAAYA